MSRMYFFSWAPVFRMSDYLHSCFLFSALDQSFLVFFSLLFLFVTLGSLLASMLGLFRRMNRPEFRRKDFCCCILAKKSFLKHVLSRCFCM